MVQSRECCVMQSRECCVVQSRECCVVQLDERIARMDRSIHRAVDELRAEVVERMKHGPVCAHSH